MRMRSSSRALPPQPPGCPRAGRTRTCLAPSTAPANSAYSRFAPRVTCRPWPRAIQSVTVLGGIPQRRAAGSMRPVWAMSLTSAFASRGVSLVGRPIRTPQRGTTRSAGRRSDGGGSFSASTASGGSSWRAAPGRSSTGLTPSDAGALSSMPFRPIASLLSDGRSKRNAQLLWLSSGSGLSNRGGSSLRKGD
jgi:hypothetical protein